jgi:hypothetical protein
MYTCTYQELAELEEASTGVSICTGVLSKASNLSTNACQELAELEEASTAKISKASKLSTNACQELAELEEASTAKIRHLEAEVGRLRRSLDAGRMLTYADVC